MKTRCLLAIFLALPGCMTVGPALWDWRVHEASSEAMQAQANDAATFYKRQAESYQAGTGGQVSVKERLMRPVMYQNGLLINRNGRPVTVAITGIDVAFGCVEDVNGETKEISVPPGHYDIKVYVRGDQYPYAQWVHFVNNVRGDGTFNGRIYDFIIFAP